MKRILSLLLVLTSVLVLVACGQTEKTLSSIKIETPATKLEYQIGDAIDLTGLVVKAVYSDQTEETIAHADFAVTGFDSTTVGEKTLTITYQEKTVTFKVDIFDPADLTLNRIEIKKTPDKQNYLVGETLVLDGLIVEAVLGNGTRNELAVSEVTTSGFSSTALKQDGVVTVAAVEDATKTATFGYKIVAILTQGVTATSVLVGNVSVTSGPFAIVGVAFNQGMQAYYKMINDAGGVNGRIINYKTYDDGFVGSTGATQTATLVNDDKVFAINGHVGTPTVGLTVDYLQTTGIPMVYAATGINQLYFEETPGNSILAVQPIYMTDGQVMTARALNSNVYGANGDQAFPAGGKVGVLHTTADDGNSIKAGIEREAAYNNKVADFKYESFVATDLPALSAAIQRLMNEGVSAIIVASNQAPFKAVLGQLVEAGSTVPVFTSYVNADATSVDATLTYNFPIFASAWVDMAKGGGSYLAEFTAALEELLPIYKDKETYPLGGLQLPGVAYAIAGWVAAHVFVEGLKAVGTEELTWESYVKAIENLGPIDIPMGGTVDFSGGKRWGIDSMALLKLAIVSGAPAWQNVEGYGMQSLSEIRQG